MQAVKQIIWKEWREKRGVVIGALVVMLALYFLGYIGPTFHIAWLDGAPMATFAGDFVWFTAAYFALNSIVSENGSGAVRLMDTFGVSRQTFWVTKVLFDLSIILGFDTLQVIGKILTISAHRQDLSVQRLNLEIVSFPAQVSLIVYVIVSMNVAIWPSLQVMTNSFLAKDNRHRAMDIATQMSIIGLISVVFQTPLLGTHFNFEQFPTVVSIIFADLIVVVSGLWVSFKTFVYGDALNSTGSFAPFRKDYLIPLLITYVAGVMTLGLLMMHVIGRWSH